MLGEQALARNCLSNIRPEGFAPAAAAGKPLWLIAEMRRLQLTGGGLKDEHPVIVPGTIVHRDAALHD
jgi:ethanolamine ammonia-lyase small subunit